MDASHATSQGHLTLTHGFRQYCGVVDSLDDLPASMTVGCVVFVRRARAYFERRPDGWHHLVD